MMEPENGDMLVPEKFDSTKDIIEDGLSDIDVNGSKYIIKDDLSDIDDSMPYAAEGVFGGHKKEA